jgi:hypothetical protein
VGHIEARPVLWINEDKRRFTPLRFGDDRGTAYAFAVADLDSDGHRDIVIARSGAENVIYFGAAGHGSE